MSAFSYILLITMLMALITLSKTAKIIAENERGAVFRLGKFMRILEPGFHILIESLSTRSLNIIGIRQK